MDLPDRNFAHLTLMTDSTGILQHGRFTVPRYEEGYCLDDNARALLLTTFLERAVPAPDPLPGLDRAGLDRLASRYLAFVSHAYDPDRGRFRNFMSFGRAWLEAEGSQDSQGRALWALGAVAGASLDPGRRDLAGQLFRTALPGARAFVHPRSWAYALLGCDAYPGDGPHADAVAGLERDLAGRLHRLYLEQRTEAWPWFEDRLTYGNARLPQALLRAGARLRRPDWVNAGLRALDWLARVQTDPQDRFAPVGSDGFYPRGGPRAWFDQQPVEAGATVAACLDALAVTGEALWLRRAEEAFAWFLGRNQVGLPLYDARTGGCRDGLHPHRANQNLGAEATLSYLLAREELAAFDRKGRWAHARQG